MIIDILLMAIMVLAFIVLLIVVAMSIFFAVISIGDFLEEKFPPKRPKLDDKKLSDLLGKNEKL